MEAANEKENNEENTIIEVKPELSFKKPVLIGKIGKLPRKIEPKASSAQESNLEKTNGPCDPIKENDQLVVSKRSIGNIGCSPNVTPVQETDNNIPLPYKEPSWSGTPESNGKDYVFEIFKNGSIIETINLMNRPFWVFGRLTNCHISMQHPTISRYHAILQYRNVATESESPGFYIYDLGSTHGTFLNKNRLKPKVFVRIQVGHFLKLGCSTRNYFLNGPENDTEEESELSVAELKQKRAAAIKKREEEAKEAAAKLEKEREEKRKKDEERGIDWGLGEDADEDTDLSENPYAQSNNEELYLDDPKKALRGFFEREGVDLEYDCNEQGIGQFLCKVELPLDDELGRPIIAEVLHKGKKKEAVVQCALEACRILDRHGVLRQATHESRKRKAKNWEEDDFYDSDDDTFLDRTGTIEKKREMRMKAKVPQKAETYESLLEKEKNISESISNIEKQLAEAQAKLTAETSNNEEDSLDSFMKELKKPMLDKQTVIRLKMELTKLKQEHAKVIKLANIAKPATLPALVSTISSGPSTSNSSINKLPIFGKRLKLKLQSATTKPICEDKNITNVEEEDEIEEKEHEVKSAENSSPSSTPRDTESQTGVVESISPSSSDEEAEALNSGDINTIKSLHNTMTFKKFEKILKKGLPPFADKHQEKLEKILNNLKKLATNEDRMHVDWKILAAKKRKVMKLISDLRNCEPNEKLEHKVSSELNRILQELNTMTEQKYKVIGKVKKMGNEIKNISEAIDKDFKQYKKEISKSLCLDSSDSEPSTSAATDENNVVESNLDESMDSEEKLDEKKKKKNQRRIQQRQGRAEVERQRGYQEDSEREDYNMWVPPSNQSGDGRTSLNDRLGY